MMEAWARREMECRDFLKGILEEVWIEDELRRYLQLLLRLSIEISYELEFRAERIDGETKEIARVVIFDNDIHGWAQEHVYDRIKEFSRAIEEENALLAEFLRDHLLLMALSRFAQALSQKKFNDPRIIFRAEGAMEEVPFPDDE